jgi:hypothetical protein
MVKKSKDSLVRLNSGQVVGIVLGILLTLASLFPLIYIIMQLRKEKGLSAREVIFNFCNHGAMPSAAFLIASGFIGISLRFARLAVKFIFYLAQYSPPHVTKRIKKFNDFFFFFFGISLFIGLK